MESKPVQRKGQRVGSALPPLHVPGAASSLSGAPVESPTVGAATAFATASLHSPTLSNSLNGAKFSAQPRSSSALAGKSHAPSLVPNGPLHTSGGTYNLGITEEGCESPSKRRRNPSADVDERLEDPTLLPTVRSPALSHAPPPPPPPLPVSAVTLRVESSADGKVAEDDQPLSPAKRSKSVQAPAKLPQTASTPNVTVVDIFSPGMLRVPVFRIPALLSLPDGAVLAFSEARPHLNDHGVINIVMRRSTDSGITWSTAKVCVEGRDIGMACGGAGVTVGNPAPVFDAATGTIWLFHCSNHAQDLEWMIHARQGKDREGRRVWLASSTDMGMSWSTPREITSSTKKSTWTWYATGPGVGLQLESGRLIVPCNHAEDVHEPNHPYLPDRRRSRMVAHTVYSDDHGATWRVGGIAANHTNETTIAELADGQLIMNSRDWSGRFLRQIQLSQDGGLTWKPPRYDPTLIEPEPQGCQGSMLAVKPPHGRGANGKGVLFFCNPSSDRREMLTIRRSDDGGLTWSAAYLLEERASAYSSMGMLADGMLGVLYERSDRISFAKIPSHPHGPLGEF